MRTWKKNHEAMISEVRTKGYSDSLALLQSGRMEPAVARKLIVTFEDHRALWYAFDAEFPDRVRQSLDRLRSRIAELRGEIPAGSPLDVVMDSLRKTILTFFDQVEHTDLSQLRCDSRNPEWVNFSQALGTLRKAIGLQLDNLITAYGLSVGDELKRMLPQKVS